MGRHWVTGHRLKLPKVLLAGMNIAASPQLAAAVTNAGGLGVWGGVFYTPKMFRAKLKDGGLGCGDGHGHSTESDGWPVLVV